MSGRNVDATRVWEDDGAVSNPSNRFTAAVAHFQRGELVEAQSLAETILVEQGESAPLQHLLGAVRCRAGDLAGGIVHLEAAARLSPNDPAILVLLMRALIDTGRAGDALACSFQAEGLSVGGLLALWRTRSEAAHYVGDMASEADALDKIVQLDPRDDRARDHLVRLLLALDRPAVALAYLDGLPVSPNRERARSASLSALRQFDAAAVVDAQLFEENPQDRDAWLSLLILADRNNDQLQLTELVEAVAHQGYRPAEIDFAKALLSKLEGALDKAFQSAKASELSADPARRFALIALLADRLGLADEAVAAATAKAAAIVDRETWAHRGLVHRQDLRRLCATITSQWFARWPDVQRSPRRTPVFLVGFPRSGTTLLDTFLMGHPDILVLEEQSMLDRAAQEVGDLNDLDHADAATIERARDAYFAELDQLAPELTERPRLVIDKLPLALSGAVLIHRLFPDARFIFAKRHPADALISNIVQGFKLNSAMANFLDLADAADFYDCVMSLWTRVREVIPLNVKEITYEQLVDGPSRELRPLIEWLGLSWHEALLDHQRTARGRGVIITPSYDQVTQPIHRRSVGRWRAYSAFLQPVLHMLSLWATRLGYGPIDDESQLRP